MTSFNLAQLHDAFVNEQRYSTRLSPVTLRGYGQSIRLFTSIMPTTTIEQLTATSMIEFFRRLETRTRIVGRGIERRGVRTSTIATYRSQLNRFFAWLKQQGHIRANPLDDMPYPDVHYEDRKFLSRAAVERIFTALVLGADWRSGFIRKRNIALLSMLLYTGVRKGELLGLRVTDVDWHRLEVTVRAETSKSRIRRVIPINSRLAATLRDYTDERCRRQLKTEYLFASSSSDDRLTADGLKHLVEQVKRLSGVRFHPHQFRHTFAVNILKNGCDVAKLKQLMGHRDIRMTSAYLRCLPTSAMRSDMETLTLDNLL